MYCSKADLIRAFGEIEINRIAMNDDEIDKAIADAQAEIDMYLSARYVLPLVTIPPILNRLACDIAHYYLYVSIDENSTVNLRYQQRLRQLKAIATGQLSIGNVSNQAESETVQAGDVGVVFFEVGGKVFSRKA